MCLCIDGVDHYRLPDVQLNQFFGESFKLALTCLH